jgi:hypothetical protein
MLPTYQDSKPRQNQVFRDKGMFSCAGDLWTILLSTVNDIIRGSPHDPSHSEFRDCLFLEITTTPAWWWSCRRRKDQDLAPVSKSSQRASLDRSMYNYIPACTLSPPSRCDPLENVNKKEQNAKHSYRIVLADRASKQHHVPNSPR